MNQYKYGDTILRAWSEMNCGDEGGHDPHVWDGEFCLYGPYFCWGSHPPKHRKRVISNP